MASVNENNSKPIDNNIFYKGVVESVEDKLKLGRVQVRVFGLHPDDLGELPTSDLPWAMTLQPTSNKQECPYRPGDWVLVTYLDAHDPTNPSKKGEFQNPVVLGLLTGILPESISEATAFGDCTSDNIIPPRPPDQSPIEPSDSVEPKEEKEKKKSEGMFSDPDSLPGNTTAFGVLKSEYDQTNYKFDVTKNCFYDNEDAEKIIGKKTDKPFNGVAAVTGGEASFQRYPFESSEFTSSTNEPTLSRLARNENIEQTIVTPKQSNLASGTAIGHITSGVGSDEGVADETFQEPKTPYNTVYPFNHVTESESGHTIEIDDTPGAERLHWYHRSGTFNEIHPEGEEVNNVKKSEYNIVAEDFYKWTGASNNMHSAGPTRIYAEDVLNLTSDKDINRNAGNNLNTLILADANTRVMANNFSVTEKETKHHTKEGIYIACIKDVIHIWAKDNVCVHSEKNIQLDAKDSIIINAGKKIDINAPIINMGPNIVNANVVFAQTAAVAATANPGTGYSIPAIVIPPVILDNKADDNSWYDDMDSITESATLKEGFMFPKFGAKELLYKPMADGAPKTARILCAGASTVSLYEALPTGELEEATIKYKHKDGSITEWTTIRPVHKLGELIETNTSNEMFEDSNRNLHRMLKAGTKYPKQMFLSIDGSKNIDSCVLILNSAVRHESLSDFQEAIPYKQNPSLKKTTPKEGYILPKFAGSQLLYKPMADGAPKTARILATSSTIAIYEATPTNDTCNMLTKYKHLDNSITEKVVNAPVYKIGQLIEKSITNELFEGIGPRFNHRMKKPGKDYPSAFFISIDGTNKEANCVLVFDNTKRAESLGDFKDIIK